MDALSFFSGGTKLSLTSKNVVKAPKARKEAARKKVFQELIVLLE
jgi:hypothetical protein